MVVCSNRPPVTPLGHGGISDPGADTGRIMARKRAKKKTFSAVKAVKANARERVGQPKPERIIPAVPRAETRGRKHPKTLTTLLTEED
jgi:hypothetical protein